MRYFGSVLALFGLALCLFVLFQNCSGEFKFDPNSVHSSSGPGLGDDVDFTMSKSGAGVDFTNIRATNQYLLTSTGGADPGAEYHFALANDTAICSLTAGSGPSSRTLYCTQAGSVVVLLSVLWSDGRLSSRSRTLTILTSTGATPTPTPSATPSATPNGATLYMNNCQGCHGPLATSAKRGRTATQIQNAINTVGAMMGISLTTAEIQAIAAALQ